jgi:transcriptional regulator with XRE-family HTH domain
MTDTVNAKIKKLRKRQGLTLQQLSELTDLSKGYLSKIESSTFAPRIQTLNKIAGALNTDIGYFLEEFSGEEKKPLNIDLVKKNQHPHKTGEYPDFGYSYISLVHSYKGKYMAPYILQIEEGSTEIFTHDSEEFVYILQGPLKFFYDGIEYDLDKGDSVYFDSRIEHSLLNEQKKDALVLNVTYDYRRF